MTMKMEIILMIIILHNSGGGGYIIQSPTQPVNPIEVFPVASPGTYHHHQHHHHCNHDQHDGISRGPLHVPGLSNPRHDPWSAALLPRTTLHTGICHHYHDYDYSESLLVIIILIFPISVDGGLPHGGSWATASYLPSQVNQCPMIFEYLDLGTWIWINSFWNLEFYICDHHDYDNDLTVVQVHCLWYLNMDL